MLCIKPSLDDYWEMTYWLTQTLFKRVMSKNWYQILCTLYFFKHFCYNVQMGGREKQRGGQQGYNPLFKIHGLLDIILQTFGQNYITDQHPASNESMVKLWGKYTWSNISLPNSQNGVSSCLFLADSPTHYCLGLKNVYRQRARIKSKCYKLVHELYTSFLQTTKLHTITGHM